MAWLVGLVVRRLSRALAILALKGQGTDDALPQGSLDAALGALHMPGVSHAV
jgi:hypothetical protein